MKLSTVIASVNNNSNYYSFIPKQILFWNRFKIRFIAVFIGEKIPEELQAYYENIIVWNKNIDLHSAYLAQNIRIFYPALLHLPQNEMVMITDMDMLPMSYHYYTSGLDDYKTEDFIYYRKIDGKQIYMCYNAAHPSIWAKVFQIKSEADIERKLNENYYKAYDGIPGSSGWYNDQEIMYSALIDYPHLHVLNRPIRRLEVDMYWEHLSNGDCDFISKYDDAHFHRSYFDNESLILNAEQQLPVPKELYKGFIIFLTKDWLDIVMNLIHSVLLFSKYDIEVYCINFEHNFKNKRIKHNTIQLNYLHFFNITKCKLIATINTLFDYALLLDGDMIVTPDIDKIFIENESRIQLCHFPLFAKHPGNPFSEYPEIISSITSNSPKMKWVFSNYLFIRTQIWFLEEVLKIMDKVTDYSFYYPVPEEGIINALLAKYQVDYDLGYNYFPAGILSVVEYYIDGKNVEGKKHIEDGYLIHDCPIKIYAFHGHDIKNIGLGKRMLEKICDAFLEKKKVITFSLWGDKPDYNIGAIINATDALKMYPDFECWFYIHSETVPKETIDALSIMSNVKIIWKEGDLSVIKPMMWRFEAIDDPSVEIMMSRDTDTRFLQRERMAVDEWLNSNFTFHIMRDHPDHRFAILGGMFGTKKISEISSWITLMENFDQCGSSRDYDQDFLELNIYHYIKNRVMIHATFCRAESICRDFPIPYDDDYRFVGEYVKCDNSRNENAVQCLRIEYSKLKDTKIHIISTFYISNMNDILDNERNQELEESLLENLQLSIVEKIHLFVEDNFAMDKLMKLTNNSNKIVIISIGIKPNYSQIFKYILNNLKNHICMIINADIFIYKYDLKVINFLKDCKWIYALTRYEYDLSYPLISDYQGSHDAYLFNSFFLTKSILNEYLDFYQNQPGIETRIIKNFYDNGFNILNPCIEIQIVHLHKSNLRNYHSGWIGLHNHGDIMQHKQSNWWIPPIRFL